MNKILITGTAGFIGFHLVRRFSALGYDIDGIDNINSYYDVSLKNRRLAECGINISALKSSQWLNSSTMNGYRFMKLDLSDSSETEKLFNENKYTVVIHLAAQAGVRYSLENPHAYVDSNLQGFVNVLEGCRHNHVQHLIYASSSSVYGGNTKVPFSEDDRVDTPVSLYAATKRSNELMAHTYTHLYGFPTTGLRFFTVYGPWGRPDMAYYLFTEAIKKGDPIKVFNNGNMQRDFTYVDDIVEGIIGLEKTGPDSGQKNRLFNIGNSRPEKLLDMILILEELIGKQAEKKYLPMQPGDVEKTWADISRLSTATGYTPVTCLRDGLSSFIEWHNNFTETEGI